MSSEYCECWIRIWTSEGRGGRESWVTISAIVKGYLKGLGMLPQEIGGSVGKALPSTTIT